MDDRIKAATAALLVQGLLGYALIAGLGVRMAKAAQDSLTLLRLAPEPHPPPAEKPIPPKVRSQKPEGAAAPPNIRSKATQIVAPPPVVPVPPSPVIVAPIAALGDQATQGAAPVAGSGTGAGGVGNGTGSGGRGNGDGGGAQTPPRWIKGNLKDSDYPRQAGDEGAQGRVWVRFTVEPDGRVDQCLIRRSSGNTELDATTCRLIEKRYRYRPALDTDGKPVRSFVVEEHEWDIEPADEQR